MNNFKLAAFSAMLTTMCLITACSGAKADIDLDKVLEVTKSSLGSFDKKVGSSAEVAKVEAVPTDAVQTQDDKIDAAVKEAAKAESDAAMKEFAKVLQSNLNQTNPKLYQEAIGVNVKDDGSIQGFHDQNKNDTYDSGEQSLFVVEIDGENSRLVASAGEVVSESGFSGSGLLMGMLIGNMLSRQRGAGVNPSSISNKKSTPKPARNARTRSTSGSHSRGK